MTIGFQDKTQNPLKIGFVGASSRAPMAVDLQPSQTNYLLGSDPSLWRTHVPNYARVSYPGLYQGVDAVFYGNGQRLEHDFIVAPGADYRQIRMHFSEDAKVVLGEDGTLRLKRTDGSLQLQRPILYQEENGKRQERRGSFRILSDGDVGFDVTSYDPSRRLVIDPVLSFSTYVAPVYAEANLVATDNAGSSYVVGTTKLGFPVTTGAFSGCDACDDHVVTFISKVNSDGTALVYSTVVGGHGFAQPVGIGVDSSGNAVVAGWTVASDFPTKNGQPIVTQGNDDVGFLVSLSPDGSALNYGTLIGNRAPFTGSDTTAEALALDPAGNAYVTGYTAKNFYTTPGAVNKGGLNNQNVFLQKFSAIGELLYSAVLGAADAQNGGGGPVGASAVAVDAAGNAYVAGQAGTLWPISEEAYLKKIPGAKPYATPFVTKVSADASSLLYSTFLHYAYVVTGIVVLPDGDVFITGNGVGKDYPTTPDAFQKNSASGGGAFLSELDATGSSLLYSTIVGDPAYVVNGIAVDTGNGDLWLAAQSSSASFPVVEPLQSTFPVFSDSHQTESVVNQFDPSGRTLKFSTFLGGEATGSASSVAIDKNHRAHVAGSSGYGMYTTPGVLTPEVPQPDPYYGYVALIDPLVPAPALCVLPNSNLDFAGVTAGTSEQRPLTITSCGTQPLTIKNVSASAGVFSVPTSTDGCTKTLPVGQSCTLSVSYTPTGAETDSSTLIIESDASIPEAMITLTGSGVVPVISLFSSPVFNYAIIRQTGTGSVVLENRGLAPLIIDPAKTTTTGDFRLASPGDCGSAVYDYCRLTVSFSPKAAGTRTGTLSIASNDPATPNFLVQLSATGYAEAPTPQIIGATAQLVPAGTTLTDFSVMGLGFLPSSVIEINGVPQLTTYQDSQFLHATLTAASIPANSYGELALTVVTPGPGGGISAPFTLTKYQVAQATNAFLVYEPISKRLFSSVPASATTHPNTIVPIDPQFATMGTPIPVGKGPNVLAVSDDGKYLYVALDVDHTIQRVNLATRSVERTFALPDDQGLSVSYMHVVPGRSTEVIASLKRGGSPSEAGIALFNDAGLVNWIPSKSLSNAPVTISTDDFTFTKDPVNLYAVDADTGGFAELSYSSAGLGFNGSECCVPAYGAVSNGDLLASDGTLLYTDSGLVWNPADGGHVVTSYSLPTGFFANSEFPDNSTGKTYFLNETGGFLAFDQASSAQTGALSFGADSRGALANCTQVVRWGSNGFACRNLNPLTGSGASIVLFTSSIASDSNVVPSPAATTLSPASTPAAGGDFVITVTGSSLVPGSAILWNNTPRITTFVSSTQVTATIYSSDIATMGSAQVVVVNPGPGGGFSAALPFDITAPVPKAPLAVLTPAALSFAAEAVGTSSGAQVVTLTNSGTADLLGIAITVAGTNNSSFAQTSTCGSTLPIGKSCAISVIFTPASPGDASAALVISDNAAASPQLVSLSGSGTAPAVPLVTLTPASLSFASQIVGTSSSAQVVTLTNSGTADLTGIVVGVAGTGMSSFAQTNTCGAVVPAGKSCIINVVFSPSMIGAASATITVSDNAASSPQAVALSGTAVAVPTRIAVLAPQSLAFASQVVGSSSSPLTITLSNTGNAPLAEIVIALTGASASSFNQTNTCGAGLDASATCTISVIFTPSVAGNAVASVIVTSTATNSPQTVSLTGTAPESPFTITPQSGGSTSSTVASGQPASYALAIAPVAGYTGTVTLQCDKLPANASCSFNPSKVTPTGGSPAAFTVTIATQASQSSTLLRNLRYGSVLACFIILVPFRRRRRTGASAAVLGFVLLAAMLGVSACGSSSASSTPPAVAKGTYTVQVVASESTSTQMLPLTLTVQ